MREQRQTWGLRLEGRGTEVHGGRGTEYMQKCSINVFMYVISLSFDSKCPKNCFECLFLGRSLDCEKLYERTCIHLARLFLKQS